MCDLYSKPEGPLMGGPRGPAGQLVRRMFLEARRAARADMGIFGEEEDGRERPEDSIDIFPRTFSSEYVVRAMVGDTSSKE